VAQIRSFIAIELPDELKKELAELVDGLKSSGQSGVKWVNPYSIHLTLKFLGNIDTSRIDEIVAVIERSVQDISPFQIGVGKTGVFPNLRRVQVVWVGLKGDVDKLAQIQQSIESGLAPLGFPAESRKFTPHLTLARLRNQATQDERQRIGQIITATEFESSHGINVNAISLMKSQLTREGAIYSRINIVRL